MYLETIIFKIGKRPLFKDGSTNIFETKEKAPNF